MNAKQMQDESRRAVAEIDFHPDREEIEAALNRGLYVVIEAVPALGPFGEVLGMIEYLHCIEGSRADAESVVDSLYASVAGYDDVYSIR